MAGIAVLGNRGSERTHTLLRLSFNSFLRSFVTDAPPTPNISSSSTNKKTRRKKKNLFEVAQFLPNWGIGYHMAKSRWSGLSYEITKINLYKDGKHGKAWGIPYKGGLPAADEPKKLSGVNKRYWKYLPNAGKATKKSTDAKVEEKSTDPNGEEKSTDPKVEAA